MMIVSNAARSLDLVVTMSKANRDVWAATLSENQWRNSMRLGGAHCAITHSVNPHPISISLSIKYSFWPSLLYGFYGIYYKWDRRKQTSRPPRSRHPHD